MLNNRTTPPRPQDLEHETAVWERLRAEVEAGRRSSDVFPAQRDRASQSAYLEYDDEELSAAMQAEEQDAPGRSPREHEFSDLEERISEDSVPLDDAALLLDVHDEVQVIPPVGRRSQPPMPEGMAVHDAVDAADEAQTGERISYFEKAQAEAYQQTPIAAFAQEHAASLARAQGQSRYEQAWADWDRQFDLPTPVVSAPIEPARAKRPRLLIPGLALAAVVGLGIAGYQLGGEPSQDEQPTQAAAAPTTQAAEPSQQEETARVDEAQRAADEAAARADEAAKAGQGTADVAAEDDKDSVKAKVAAVDEESPQARRERIREEKRAARREARHRRREERRLAAKEGARSDDDESVTTRQTDDDETVVEPPAASKKKRSAKSKSADDADDPLYGID